MRRRSRTVSGVSRRGRVVALLMAFVVACAALVASAPVDSARALSGSDFKPGLIISDDLFYDGASMTASQIQAFLNGKIGSCQNGNCLNVAVVPVVGQAATYGSRTNSLICSAISGGTLSVAELIYRAQVACGISAKVILVTLQKEQGLVTKRAPSDSALQKAMGMACPDTAPCDQAFAGLATQIIAGTKQLKVYRANSFLRQPGVSYIQFSPNAACGGTNVMIQNYATAALYNYTPYQPNGPALDNLGGTGDGCSSYGNRNFWWYYNQWFGSTIVPPCTLNPTRDISQYWNDQGGAAGALGSLVSPGIVPGPAGTTIGNYTNGAVYCTPGSGAVSVLGQLRVKYDSLGGPASAFGSPVAERTSYVGGGLSGYLQIFKGGSLQTSTQTGTFGVQFGPIRDAWGARGGSGGVLGWPIGDQQAVAGGVRQQFQNGLLMAPIGRPVVVLAGPIETYWLAGSNAATLGSPTTGASAWSAGGVDGTLQYFDRGIVLSSTVSGTFAVLTGPIRTAWGDQGGSGGSLGWPTADQHSEAGGGYSQGFQHGQVFGSSSGAGGTLSGDFATYWSAGSNASLLGYPTGAPSPWTAGRVTGTLQYFERGMVLSSSKTGTHGVFNGAIRDAWGARGGSGGSLGWPIGELKVGANLTQQFEEGTLTVASGVSGDIGTYWATGSNGSLLGAPTSSPSAYSAGGVTGTVQYFANGLAMSSSTTGTFAVLSGGIRDAWGALGGSGGSLGWPTGDRTSVSGGKRQLFQHGSIFQPLSGSAVVLSGDIATYWSTGSNGASLGSPTSSSSSYSAGGVSGTLQYFANGLVLSSSLTGTFAVLSGGLRDAWGALGGSGGSLGWPTGDQTAISGGKRQVFQHGWIIQPSVGTAVVLSGDIATYWSTGSNGTLLGAPTSSSSSYSAGGVSGTLQYFERGLVLSAKSTGTFAVLNGAVRNAWGALDGSGGTLGWPTGDQETISGNVRQNFQHGTVTVAPDGAPIVLSGAYFTYWATGSNSTLLGAPNAPKAAWSAGGVAGSYEEFEHGIVMSSTATGTFAVLDGPIRDVWGGAGGSGGSLGWPIADQASVSGGIQQKFQHGLVMVPTTGNPYLILG